jgi:hypothetical protein
VNYFLANMEKAAQRSENWVEEVSPGNVETMRQFMQQMRSGSMLASRLESNQRRGAVKPGNTPHQPPGTRKASCDATPPRLG